MKRHVLTCLAALSLAAGACDTDEEELESVDADTETDAAQAPDIDAGPTGSETFNFSLELNGYGRAHDGDTLYFALFDDEDARAPIAMTSKTIASGGGGGGGGGNRIKFDDALESTKSYTLYFYADIDANESCEAEVDHHWSLAIPEVSGDVAEAHQHTTEFDGDCARHQL